MAKITKKQRKWMHANKPKMAKKWKKYATGGAVDDVPALLTEGEYVIKKSSAEAIGYDNLDRINASGALPIQDARKRRRNK